jgi:hypothetical protein
MRYFLGTILTLMLTLCFSWVFGHIQFSDDAAYALERLGASLGIYGIENLEDFYLIATLVISFCVGLLIVLRLNSLIKKR